MNREKLTELASAFFNPKGDEKDEMVYEITNGDDILVFLDRLNEESSDISFDFFGSVLSPTEGSVVATAYIRAIGKNVIVSDVAVYMHNDIESLVNSLMPLYKEAESLKDSISAAN